MFLLAADTRMDEFSHIQWTLARTHTDDLPKMPTSDDLPTQAYRFQVFVWLSSHAAECVPVFRTRQEQNRLFRDTIRPLSELPAQTFTDFACKVAKWRNFKVDKVTQYQTDGWDVEKGVLACSMVFGIGQVLEDKQVALVAFLTARLHDSVSIKMTHEKGAKMHEAVSCWWVENDTYDSYWCGSQMLYASVYEFLFHARACRMLLEFDASNVKAKEIVHVALKPSHCPSGLWQRVQVKGKRGTFYQVYAGAWTASPPIKPRWKRKIEHQTSNASLKQLQSMRSSTAPPAHVALSPFDVSRDHAIPDLFPLSCTPLRTSLAPSHLTPMANHVSTAKMPVYSSSQTLLSMLSAPRPPLQPASLPSSPSASPSASLPPSASPSTSPSSSLLPTTPSTSPALSCPLERAKRQRRAHHTHEASPFAVRMPLRLVDMCPFGSECSAKQDLVHALHDYDAPMDCDHSPNALDFASELSLTQRTLLQCVFAARAIRSKRAVTPITCFQLNRWYASLKDQPVEKWVHLLLKKTELEDVHLCYSIPEVTSFLQTQMTPGTCRKKLYLMLHVNSHWMYLQFTLIPKRHIPVAMDPLQSLLALAQPNKDTDTDLTDNVQSLVHPVPTVPVTPADPAVPTVHPVDPVPAVPAVPAVCEQMLPEKTCSSQPFADDTDDFFLHSSPALKELSVLDTPDPFLDSFVFTVSDEDHGSCNPWLWSL